MTALQDEIRRAHLPNANRVRIQRARLMQQLHDREVHVCDILADPPACIGEMFAHDLLLRAPGFGPTRLESLGYLAMCDRMPIYVRLGRMHPQAREWLIRTLRTEVRPRAASRVEVPATDGAENPCDPGGHLGTDRVAFQALRRAERAAEKAERQERAA